MYRLTRNKKTGFFHLAFYAKNGRELFDAGTFTQKPSALANIKATIKEMGNDWAIMQDDSLLEGSKVYVIDEKEMYESSEKARKFTSK